MQLGARIPDALLGFELLLLVLAPGSRLLSRLALVTLDQDGGGGGGALVSPLLALVAFCLQVGQALLQVRVVVAHLIRQINNSEKVKS